MALCVSGRARTTCASPSQVALHAPPTRRKAVCERARHRAPWPRSRRAPAAHQQRLLGRPLLRTHSSGLNRAASPRCGIATAIAPHRHHKHCTTRRVGGWGCLDCFDHAPRPGAAARQPGPPRHASRAPPASSAGARPAAMHQSHPVWHSAAFHGACAQRRVRTGAPHLRAPFPRVTQLPRAPCPAATHQPGESCHAPAPPNNARRPRLSGINPGWCTSRVLSRPKAPGIRAGCPRTRAAGVRSAPRAPRRAAPSAGRRSGRRLANSLPLRGTEHLPRTAICDLTRLAPTSPYPTQAPLASGPRHRGAPPHGRLPSPSHAPLLRAYAPLLGHAGVAEALHQMPQLPPAAAAAGAAQGEASGAPSWCPARLGAGTSYRAELGCSLLRAFRATIKTASAYVTRAPMCVRHQSFHAVTTDGPEAGWLTPALSAGVAARWGKRRAPGLQAGAGAPRTRGCDLGAGRRAASR